MEINFMTLLLTFAVIFIIVEMTKLNRKLNILQSKVDQLAGHFNQIDQQNNDEIQALLEAEEDAVAIRKAKATFGLSLVEAQKYVEELKVVKSREK